MDDYDLLKVSIQSALVGVVPDNLFAITAGIGHKHIILAAYFEGPVQDEDRQLLRRISREVLADLPDGYSSDEHSYSRQDTELRMLDFWAFLRAPSQQHRVFVSRPSKRLAVGC